MSRLFPFRSPAEIQDESPRVLSLSGDEADDVFAALSSGTARALLAALYDEPRPTSELADELDTSIQNARYHLGNLQDAGLVEVVDTWYSEQGNEMKVYAPTNGALVLFEGQPESRTTLRDAVTRLLGGVGVLGLAGLLIDRGADMFRGLVPSMGSSGGDAGSGGGGGGADGSDGATTAGDGGGEGDGGDVGDGGGAGDGGDGGDAGTTTEATSPEPTETTAEATQTATQTTGDGTTTAATQTSPEPTTAETTVAATQTYTTEATEATQTTVEATRTAAPTTEPATTTAVTTAPPGTFEAVTGVPLTPGLAFFLGGLVVLLAGFAWWYNARGPLG